MAVSVLPPLLVLLAIEVCMKGPCCCWGGLAAGALAAWGFGCWVVWATLAYTHSARQATTNNFMMDNKGKTC
ncbi:hypothetical protein COO60DRAFT_1539042 [Scenedesmus sp. NREL 46B-D3]|nr:hypothetical protein COO60DRAFT_1539042 [Scenedesmus sp. NREL 46B-D3]